jgi:hypothetical protein
MKHYKSLSTGIVATMCLLLMSFSTQEAVRPKTGINNTLVENISLKELNKLDELTINTNTDDLNVISFRIVLAPQTGEATMKTYKGNTISDTWMLSKIQSANVTDRILVDQVLAQYSNGLKTYCDPAMHTLVE